MSTPSSPPFEPAGRFEKKALKITQLDWLGIARSRLPGLLSAAFVRAAAAP